MENEHKQEIFAVEKDAAYYEKRVSKLRKYFRGVVR